MSTETQCTCPSCGNELSGTIEFCPVCVLRKALAAGFESGESSPGDTLESMPEQPAQRFDHYELVTGEDGKPLELGRGAMGVTYKAFDINLHCPVTLKVISERYLGDESARLRFLREARAPASVRHPNVASVFHLGRTEGSYFYAMEFVEGEIWRSHQTLRSIGRKTGVGNYNAGCRRFGSGPQAETGSPRYQAHKHHGEVEGGTRCNGENYRPRLGEETSWYARVCQS